MPQKLSAMNYIKNNKRRAAVLIVSLSLCFVLTYLAQFVLSTTEESFASICMENTKKIQYISLAGSSLGVDVSLSLEEFTPLYEQANMNLAEELKKYEGVKETYYAQVIWCAIFPAVGNLTFEMPLVEAETVPLILGHVGAKLKEGRMPENPGEILLDEASMKNNDLVLGGYADKTSSEPAFQIVGVLDCDIYFGCGIPSDKRESSKMIVVLSEGIDDISALLKEEGIEARENYDTIVDYNWGVKFLQEEVKDVIGNSTSFIYVGTLLLLSIALLIVYTMYLRDRHNEWCLYCSIGYARRTIYFSILRELLFTFGAALAIGGILIVISEVLLNAALIEPLGLKCRYFSPNTLGEIFCAYVLIFGILQIPVRYALYRIRTIDAMEDDLY